MVMIVYFLIVVCVQHFLCLHRERQFIKMNLQVHVPPLGMKSTLPNHLLLLCLHHQLYYYGEKKILLILFRSKIFSFLEAFYNNQIRSLSLRESIIVSNVASHNWSHSCILLSTLKFFFFSS